MYLLDSNIFINHFNDHHKATLVLEKYSKNTKQTYISVLTECEVLSFASLTDQQINKIKVVLEPFIALPITSEICQLAGMLRRKYKINTIDALIAATAKSHNVTLITFDKDFEKIKGISVEILPYS